MKAVFLDRDGTINVEESDYLTDIHRLTLFDESYKAIELLNQHGYKTIVITNQSCVEKGLLTEEELQRINEKMKKTLASRNAKLDSIYYCPHNPENNCACRKPKTGMIDQAVKEHGIHLKKSFVIGDRLFDIGAGKAAGCKTVLVLTGAGKETHQKLSDPKELQPDFIANHILEAVQWIVSP